MVLFKRKPVQRLPRPPIEDDDADVWVIGRTGEIFTDYESYLQRMDFYKQRRFICEITGHSCLTFFEALSSETANSRDVEKAFPDALREPVLRKVQFSTVSRIDNLVDYIFDEFKQDFYPGEHVTVSIDNGERLSGVVREKAKFSEQRKPDGTLERKAFSRYFVALLNQPDKEALVDDEHIVRDRKTFTKQMLRSFIKNTVTRDAWTGAPWLVKENIAARLKIDSQVPAHLQYGSKIAEKKAQLARKKGDHDGAVLDIQSSNPRLPELKPATKSHKSKQLQQQLARNKQQQFLEYQQALAQHEGLSTSPGRAANGLSHFVHSNFPAFAPLAAKDTPKPPPPPPPPPIKYPIEDLDVAPLHDGTHRPSLSFPADDLPDGRANDDESGVRMESIGPLLETWETLNVYCEIFQLDSFTFDDYLEALQVSSEEVACQLFVEIHCAVLKILVDEEKQGGKIHVNLPEMPEDDDHEEDRSSEETSAIPSPTPEPEPMPTRRTTRSSLGQAAEAAAAAAKEEDQRSRSPTAEIRLHRAVEMLAEYGWVDRLQKRDFEHGGWEIIVVGLLYQLSRDARHEKVCDEILKHLAPVDEEPTQDTARRRYASLDVNLRIKALQIICMLTVETKAIRGYMEECSEQMTVFRKEKTEWQRARKAAIEELRLLNEERKVLLPDNVPPSPEPEGEQNGDTKMAGIDDEEDDELEDSEDEEPHAGRSLRRGFDRAAERKRKREEEKEKRERAEAAAKVPKMSSQFKKILKEIERKKGKVQECEDEIATLDNDLREADCPRTRSLGRDRFWNRYWWFERNGMPYAGLPTSSTAQAGYANGCIWVQGPDHLEREGFIDVSGDDEAKYQKAFQMTVRERKRLEEGATSLYNAHQWGYYEKPDSLDMLIGWLDVRGNRESKLRKELQAQREKISSHMARRLEYMRAEEDKSVDDAAPRMSTRKRRHDDAEGYKCLAWRNKTALEDLGHLHSQQVRPRKATKKAQQADRKTRTTATNRQGKPLGRQGSRYQF
ncbi:MAG: hypothetical protein M1832_000224 [Thelocarpon impressellum]|nr:MAG: hypothetical protein M1832_000224 [Thelocarpon impressellum]